MPLNYKFLSAIVTTALILCAAAPHHGKPNKIPPVALSAESAAITLDGPCIGFSYRNTGSRRGLSLGLDDGALAATQTPWDMQREATALLCQAPGFDAGVGFLLGQHIEADTAAPYVAAGYRVDLGAWALSLTAGAIESRYSHKPHRAAGTFRVDGLSPFLLVTVRVRF